MVTPFVVDRQRCQPGPVHLLPTPHAVLVISRNPGRHANVLVSPHRQVVVIDDAALCVSLGPNVVKCLLGEPRRFLGFTLRTVDHPLLRPFATVRGMAEAAELLTDLRRSLAITPDEADFIDLWSTLDAGLPSGNRRVQRLCLRYAGQSPQAIAGVRALAATLDADSVTGRSNSLGTYADDSHLGRTCRALTGRNPSAWRNMSQTFY